MTQNRPMAYLLVLALLFTTLFGSIPAAYAADTEYTDRAYQSELSVQGTVKESYHRGETITLELKVVPSDGKAFGIRTYDNTISFDTRKFELVSAAPASGLESKSTINPEYKSDGTGTKQNIKWYYSDPAAAAQGNTLMLGSIQLKVKADAVYGTTAVEQAVEGLSDEQALLAKTVNTPECSLKIDDSQSDYFFGLEIDGGGNASYQAGDEITVRSYLTSSAVQVCVKMASTKVLFDSASFELVSKTAGSGVELGAGTSDGNTVLTAVYTNPGSEQSAKQELFTFVLKVKEGFVPGEQIVKQENSAVMEGLQPSARVSAGTLTLKLVKAGTCAFQLVPRQGQTTVMPGQQITMDLVVQADKALRPRLVNQETGYDRSVFEFVSASAADSHTTVGEKTPGKVNWLYWNMDAPAFGKTTTLGSLTLKVKDGAPLGSTALNQLEANLIVLENGAEVSYDDLTAPYLKLLIDDGQTYALKVVPSDPAMGTVQGGGDYGRNAVVPITAAALEGHRFVNWKSSHGGTFEQADAAQALFTMPASATTVTAVFAALSDPEVSPSTAFYDKYASSGALELTVMPKDYSFTGIDGMTAGTDYTIAGETLSLSEETLKKMDTGDITLVFRFSGNKTVEVTLSIADSTPKPAGVTVSGIVKGYNAKYLPTVTLSQEGSIVATAGLVKAVEISGNQYVQRSFTFEFEGIAPGTYELKAMKAAHLPVTVTTVVVGTESLDLTQDSRDAVKALELPCGNLVLAAIEDNDVINIADKNLIANAKNWNKKTEAEIAADAPEEPLTDLNGDGIVNIADKNLIANLVNWNKKPVVIK